jgi:hypothetical protein
MPRPHHTTALLLWTSGVLSCAASRVAAWVAPYAVFSICRAELQCAVQVGWRRLWLFVCGIAETTPTPQSPSIARGSCTWKLGQENSVYGHGWKHADPCRR